MMAKLCRQMDTKYVHIKINIQDWNKETRIFIKNEPKKNFATVHRTYVKT